ncbi:ovalbumin-like isoform X2 [Babylonia areolata]|uniref:ovalbumin-like isoform X2 n=1 Tax=Babylonia areolata TaxID=304850 RepID=UPI003FD4A791
MRWAGILLCLTVLAVVFHDGTGQTDQTDQRLKRREKERFRLAELARASTSFGVSLYRELASRADSNVIFSPFSVFTALSMTLLGTNGTTKAELRTVLAQRPRQGIHRALRAVIHSFPRPSPTTNVTLRMANALYYDDQRASLTSSFLRHMRRLYGAYPERFRRPEPETPINDWVYRQTGGKIRDFLSPGDITPDMMLLLLNAIYFQGTWKEIFDERSTRDQDFTTGSGRVVRVPMMSRDGAYSVKALEPGLRTMVLELPFGTDDRFSLFVLLPDDVNGLPNLESRLDSQVLEDAMSSMPQASRFQIQIPRFTLRMKTSVKETLRAMGLSRLFSDSADLSRMSPDRLKVADVMHEAVLEVDEKGATAAAVTSVGIVALSLPPQFRVDHPFLVVLRDKKARLNLFMGRVNDPSTQG